MPPVKFFLCDTDILSALSVPRAGVHKSKQSFARSTSLGMLLAPRQHSLRKNNVITNVLKKDCFFNNDLYTPIIIILQNFNFSTIVFKR